MTKKQLATRLRKVRRELDECAEWVERLAAEVDVEPAPEVELLGMSEAAEASGLQYRTFQQRYTRGTAPAPIAMLACGPIWARDDIVRWAKRAAA